MPRPEVEADFDRVLSGEGPPALFLAGAGGIGKSTLLARLERSARKRGHRTHAIDLAELPLEHSAIVGVLASVEAGSCLFVDDFEHHAGLERQYWREWLPALPEGARLVIAGRNAPTKSILRETGWTTLLRVRRLAPLDRRSSEQLLREAGVAEAEIPARVQAGRGHPLTLARLADLEALPSGEVTDAWLTESLIGSLSQVGERALLALALARRCDRALLAALLENDDVVEVEHWLRERPYVSMGRRGWTIHELYADPILRQARRVAPDTYRAMIVAGGAHLAGRLALESNAAARREILHRALSMARMQSPTADDLPEVVARAYSWSGYTDGDRDPLLAAAERFEGPDSAAVLEHHLATAPERAQVLRDADGRPVAFLTTLERGRLTAADRRVDPGAAHLASIEPTEGPALLIRHWMSLEHHQAPSRETSQVIRAFVAAAYERPGLVLHLVLESDREQGGGQPWVDHGLLEVIEDPAFEEDGRSTRMVGWNLLDEGLPDRLRKTLRLHLGEAPRSSEERSGLSSARDGAPLTEDVVGTALQDALRRFHDDEALAANPLLGLLVEGSTPDLTVLDAATKLRALLRAVTASLPSTARIDSPAELIERAYFTSPVPKQVRVAADVGMSYSTFRRHLARARQALALRLASLAQTATETGAAAE